MDKLIERIKASTPTHVGDEAKDLLTTLLSSNTYVTFSSTIIGWEAAEAVATAFIESIAKVVLPSGQIIHTLNPIYIAHSSLQIDVGGTLNYWILFYHNGHVIYVEPSDHFQPTLMVLTTQEVSDILGATTVTGEQIIDLVQSTLVDPFTTDLEEKE